MPAKHISSHHLDIRPLPMLQVYRSADVVLDAMLERETLWQRRVGASPARHAFARHVAMPLHLHYTTSAYGAFVDDALVGALFLRGRYQVLSIEALCVLPDWRMRGIGKHLLHFAEDQARRLNRNWLGITISRENEAAVNMLEGEGFTCHHQSVWCATEAEIPALEPLQGVMLRRISGFSARQVYEHFAFLDVTGHNGALDRAFAHYLSGDPLRQRGEHWILSKAGRPIAYLNRHQFLGGTTIYAASGPDWWAEPRMLSAVVSLGHTGDEWLPGLTIRSGSAGHHRAAAEALSKLGMVERPALVSRMVKVLTPAQGER